MPWTRTDAQKERLRFVMKAEEGVYSMKELCARFGVSRQAGYATLQRWREEGAEGLKERSRAPLYSPQRMSEELTALLLAMRRAHPYWGPRKIHAYLQRRDAGLVLPAASTTGELYRRAGLVAPRKQRRWVHPGRVRVDVSGPNDLWATDFKGEFRTRDGVTCYPLTVTDLNTRCLLACQGLCSIGHTGTQEVFVSLFRERGLPGAIRSDNGPPFATKAIAGLSRLNVWWTKLGIRHDRIQPGRPDQNGSHERMHRTLKQATLRPPADNMLEQQDRFDSFVREFNEERPHEALGNATPASRYMRSPREMPEKLPPPSYEGHCRIRRIRGNGILYFGDRQYFLSELLIGEDVALEEIEDGVWSIFFYDLLLARLDERAGKVTA
jgi:putative transposase